jgi:uncharacterized protein (TIGR02145 family)
LNVFAHISRISAGTKYVLSLLVVLMILFSAFRAAGQAAMPDVVCAGATKHYVVDPAPGSTYIWQVNGVIQLSTTNEIDITWDLPYTPAGSPYTLTVQEKSAEGCFGELKSGLVYINARPNVVFVPCFDTITTANAKPFKLRGGLPVGGSYSGTGVNTVTGIFNPGVAGMGMIPVTYTYTNVAGCADSGIRRIHNLPSSAVACGTLVTDVRDNKTYPTIQIGSQCWLAANLNYGIIIQSSQVQVDNCISEKYCYGNDPANCTGLGGLYQWDELMKFDNVPASQGICPPGWHVPDETEWMVLFNFYGGNGLAGRPLQDTAGNGFLALPGGVLYQDNTWSFMNTATIFWSSAPAGPIKVISHGMNIYDSSVSYYESLKNNAFPVRCLRD